MSTLPPLRRHALAWDRCGALRPVLGRIAPDIWRLLTIRPRSKNRPLFFWAMLVFRLPGGQPLITAAERFSDFMGDFLGICPGSIRTGLSVVAKAFVARRAGGFHLLLH